MSACSSDKSAFGRHQKTAVAITRVLCRKGYPNRGVLLWHSTGSGKTCSAAAAFDAVWSQAARKLVYVSSVEGLAANPPSAFHACAAMTPRFRATGVKDIERAYAARDVEFLTFAQLAHVLQLHRGRSAASPEAADAMKRFLAHSLLVVDEVHSLLTPLPGQDKECAALLRFLQDADDERTADMRVLLLTATPGDTVSDVLRLLNVVRRPGSPELKWKPDADAGRFAAKLRGLVSFFDFSADRARFPAVSTVEHAVPMSLEQAIELKKRAGKLSAPKSDSKADVRRLWQPARRYSNTLYAWPKGMDLGTFSPKLAALLDVVAKNPGAKHLVYSAFSERRGYGGHGARAIVKALVQHAGFRDFASGMTSSTTSPCVALLARGQPVDDIKAAFNADDNPRGERVRVLVATQGFNESLDLKGVRHVHVFEPLTSTEDAKQLVGRAVRMCSHSQLRHPDEWTVTVHQYSSSAPDVRDRLRAAEAGATEAADYVARLDAEVTALKGVRGSTAARARRDRLRKLGGLGKRHLKAAKGDLKRLQLAGAAPAVDSQVFELAKARGAAVERLLQLLRDAAIDCTVFRSFHARAGIDVDCHFAGSG